MEKLTYPQLYDVARELGIPNYDRMPSDELLKILKKHSNTQRTGETMVLNVQQKYKERHPMLRKSVGKVKDIRNRILRELPDVTKTDEFKRVQEQLNTLDLLLEETNPAILFFGDTKAGKSSLINLLLGVELLPVAAVNCTSCVTEIEYGAKPSLKVKRSGSRNWETIAVNWNASKPSATIEKYVRAGVDDRKKGFDFECVKITWPSKILQNGLMFVDSPGLNENEALDKEVKNYLMKAVGVVYLVNMHQGVSNSACVTLHNFKQCPGFTTERLFIVGTNYDVVNQSEVESVKKNIEKRLHDDFDPSGDWKPHCIATTTASELQKIGLTSPRHHALLSDLAAFLSSSFLMKMRGILEQIQIVGLDLEGWAKWWINQVKSKDPSEEISRYCRDLRNLQEENADRKEAVKTEIKTKTVEFVQKLQDLLRQQEAELKKLAWEKLEKSLPPHNTSNHNPESLKNLVSNKVGALQNALAKRLLQEGNYLESYCSDLLSFANNKMQLSEQALNSIEESMNGDYTNEAQTTFTQRKGMSTGFKVLIGMTSPIWVPFALVGAVLGAPVMAFVAIKNHIHKVKRYEEIEKDPKAFVNSTVKEVLDVMTAKAKLQGWLQQQLDVDKWAEEFFLCVKRKVNDYQERLKLLQEHRQNLDEIHRVAVKFQSELQEWNNQVSHMFITELSFETIKVCKQSKIAQGSTGGVWRGTLEGGETVAIKVVEVTSPQVATSILREERILRNLQTANFEYAVKLKGTFYDKETNEYNLVLEYVQNDLQIYFKKQRTPKSPLSATDLHILLQLSDALCKLGRCVHRDLKPANILLTESPVRVKLCDFGETKEGPMLMTYRGTLLYMAPEILEGKPYGAEVDVYAFSFILWQMWHGDLPYENNTLSPNEFSKKVVEEHLRPAIDVGCPQPLKDLIEGCWKPYPKDRKKPAEIHKILTQMYQQAGGNVNPTENQAIIRHPQSRMAPPVYRRVINMTQINNKERAPESAVQALIKVYNK